jgi:GH25 family lysozyme M1 (1,4-beta-N-acetylmuramidase)
VRGAGFEFAIIKATEGDARSPQIKNPYFPKDVADARTAGMLVGAYHFARPDYGNKAADEARYFVSVAGDYIKRGYLRPALDLECGAEAAPYCGARILTKAELSQWVHEWMSTVKNDTGVEPILYVNSNYTTNYLDSSLAQYSLWIAHWTYDALRSPNTGIWGSWAFWQYSDKGFVPGIVGNVDLDVFNGDTPKLNSFVIAGALTQLQRSLTVAINPTNAGTLAVDPPGTTTTGGTFNYPQGTPVRLRAQPGVSWQFSNWTGTNCAGGGQDKTITMNVDQTCTANLTQQHTLTVDCLGSGSVFPQDCGTTRSYLSGIPLVLIPLPAVGYVFSQWSGDCPGGGVCSLTVFGQKRVTVTFSKATSSPVITSVEPQSGAPGIQVTLRGKGFDSIVLLRKVTFGGKPATTVRWSDTEVVVKVPPGAGTIDVVATGPAANSNRFPFTYLPPRVDSITPQAGPKGTTVTVRGANFGEREAGSLSLDYRIKFGRSLAGHLVKRWTDEEILVEAPSDYGEGTNDRRLLEWLFRLALAGYTGDIAGLAQFAVQELLEAGVRPLPAQSRIETALTVTTPAGEDKTAKFTYEVPVSEARSFPPLAPPYLRVTNSDGWTLRIEWEDTMGAAGYDLWRCSSKCDLSDSWSKIANLPADATSYTDANVAPAFYLYYLWAYNSAGASPGVYGSEATPGAPTALRATSAGRGALRLGWKDTGTNEIGYALWRWEEKDGWVLVATTPANASSYVDRGLSRGVHYWYYLAAFNSGGYSDGVYVSASAR